AAAQDGPLVEAMAIDLRTRVRHVREDTRRTEEDVVLDHRSCVDRDVVLDLDVRAYDDVIPDEDVLAKVALLPETGATRYMAEVPNSRSGADGAWLVDVRGRMRIVRLFR